MTRVRSKFYMGIDPGTANTGISILEVNRSYTKIRLLEVVRTPANMSDELRFRIITSRIVALIEEYRAAGVICEAFEVRTWQKPMKKSITMSKLINAISVAVFEKQVPMMLSSPDLKKSYSMEDVANDLKINLLDYKIPYFSHAQDALRHVTYYVKRSRKQ
jgi:Holliday junction resolvasome RuvABC endonuclease subunit